MDGEWVMCVLGALLIILELSRQLAAVHVPAGNAYSLN